MARVGNATLVYRQRVVRTSQQQLLGLCIVGNATLVYRQLHCVVRTSQQQLLALCILFFMILLVFRYIATCLLQQAGEINDTSSTSRFRYGWS